MKSLNKNLFLSILIVVGFSALCSAKSTRPNVLFIVADDFNHWATHLARNPQAKTPNVDRLADRGITFTNAHCAAPACEPSRTALMSGQRPWTTACYENKDNWMKMVKEGQGLSAQFLKAGYTVYGSGKIYHNMEYFPSEWSEYMDDEGLPWNGNVPKNQGFHEPLKMDIQDEDIIDWHTVNWCIEKLNQNHDKPYFLACGMNKPHLPFAVPRKYYKDFPVESIQLPPYREDDLDDIPPAGVKMAKPHKDHASFQKSGRWKNAIRSYLATCAYMDMNLGRLLDALDKSDYRNNTIIVFLGDHGWHFGEKHHWKKFTLWEEATRAPLIWVVPGVTPPGSMCNRSVDFMTIYPTLCELTDLPIPKHVEGESIQPLLKDPFIAWQTPAITTHGYKNHSVRTDNWRYIRYADGSEELYDHRKDPYEWKNLAGKAKYETIKSKLAKWLPMKNAPQLVYDKKDNKTNK